MDYSYINKISYNNTSKSPIPLLYHPDHNQPYFSFTPPNADFPINFFINNAPNLHPGFIVFDYFGSGEMFYNFDHANSPRILGVSKNFPTLYSNCFLANHPKPSDSNKISLFNLDSILEYKDINSYYLFDDDQTGISSNPIFYFPIPNVLETVTDSNDDSSLINFTIPAVCEYYTDKNNLSSHYKFANVPEGSCSCSHPLAKANFTPCNFSTSSQENCNLYSPKRKVITSVDVLPYNSSCTTNFVLYELFTPASNNLRSFQIVDETNINTCLSFTSSSDISDEEVQEKVEEIFNEFLLTYQNSDISSNSFIPSKKENISFINTLLSV